MKSSKEEFDDICKDFLDDSPSDEMKNWYGIPIKDAITDNQLEEIRRKWLR